MRMIEKRFCGDLVERFAHEIIDLFRMPWEDFVVAAQEESGAELLDYIGGLEAEVALLKERLRWKRLCDDFPELDQDVEVLDVDTKHIIVGHFFDYNEGEPDSEIMFDEHEIDEYYSLDMLPKNCYWRYADLSEVKE